MLVEWEEFLLAQGARISNNQVHDFGNPDTETTAALTGNILTDLSYLSLVNVSGADAGTFLHGQFTSEVAGLPEGHVQPGAWCNPKGQVIANFILARLGDAYFLLLPVEIKDEFIKRLGMYIFRSAVVIEDCSDSLQCIGIYNREDGQVDGTKIAAMLSSQQQAIQSDGLVMFHVPVNWNRVILAGPVVALAAAWEHSDQLYHRTGTQHWKLFDVLDGMPWIGPVTSECFLPQYLNLDRISGLSFSKGCYPGQEIIARLHHKGKVKQQLYVVTMDADTQLLAGDGIYTRNRESIIGTVINTAYHPVAGIHALVTLNMDYGEAKDLYIKDKSVRLKEIITPPYLEK